MARIFIDFSSYVMSVIFNAIAGAVVGYLIADESERGFSSLIGIFVGITIWCIWIDMFSLKRN